MDVRPETPSGSAPKETTEEGDDDAAPPEADEDMVLPPDASSQTDGSWPAAPGGPAQSTAMAVIVLGAPYRFIPIYQE